MSVGPPSVVSWVSFVVVAAEVLMGTIDSIMIAINAMAATAVSLPYNRLNFNVDPL
jgi:hypothetical protein